VQQDNQPGGWWAPDPSENGELVPEAATPEAPLVDAPLVDAPVDTPTLDAPLQDPGFEDPVLEEPVLEDPVLDMQVHDHRDDPELLDEPEPVPQPEPGLDFVDSPSAELSSPPAIVLPQLEWLQPVRSPAPPAGPTPQAWPGVEQPGSEKAAESEPAGSSSSETAQAPQGPQPSPQRYPTIQPSGDQPFGVAQPYGAPQYGAPQPYGAQPYGAQPYGAQPWGAPQPYGGAPYGAVPYGAVPYGVQPGYGQPMYGQPGAYAPVYTATPKSPFESRGNTVLIMGILSLVLIVFCFGPILGPVAWIMGNGVRRDAVAAGWPEPGNNKTGRICGIVGTVVLLLGVLGFILSVANGS
jgi:hypothetical protein